MQDEEIEWDDAKAARNWSLHGVTFDTARKAFRDAFGVEWADDRQATAEERLVLLGMAENVLLFVSFTMREGRLRIISARKAGSHERRRYHDENS